ncbi:unnamed protein product [Durusdinium trenchii]|uniref:Uncharacterized protein n=1 Tax=Durusdinium trenchii TaxID=1381693 RepID=A0ABP0S1U0_9DINO
MCDSMSAAYLDTMSQPKMEELRLKYPGVEVDDLPWPKDISHWSDRDLDIFVGSGGFIKPKRRRPDSELLICAPVKDETKREEKVEPQEDLCGALRGKCLGRGCSCPGYRRWPGVGGG